MSAQPDNLDAALPPAKIRRAPMTARFKGHEHWWAALFFALVVVIAFPEVVFFGKSLVPTDNYNPIEYTFNDTNYGPGFVPPEEWGSRGLLLYANLHDPGGDWWQGEPALEFFRRSIFSGQLPFWDPSAAAGAPAYSNLQCQFLFPPQVLLSLLGSTSTQKNIYILFLFWAAGFTTYCLLRRHGVTPLGSAGGGLVFLFSGAIQELGPCSFLGQVVACMPLLLLVTRWFVDGPTWRRSMGLAGTYACVALASFPPILCAAFGCTVFHLLFTLALEKVPSRFRLLWRFATAVLLSLGLVAVYYLPALFAIARTTYATEFYRSAALTYLTPSSIFGLLSPTATGGSEVYSAPILPADIGSLYYVGTAGLLLAGLALGRATGKTRTLLVSSTVVATLTLLKIFGVQPIQWIALLPVSQNIHYYLYFGILVAFLLSVLAGIGLDRLTTGRPVIQYLAGTLIFGAGARILWVLARESGALRPYAAWRWIADYRLLIVFAAIFVVLGGMILFWRRWTRLVQVAGCLILALIFVEGVVNATYPRQRRWGIFQHPPKYVSVLQQLPRPSRMFVGATITANLGSAFGLETLDSLYMFSPPGVYDIYLKYAVPNAAITLREATVLPPEPVLDRCGISHVLIRQQLPGLFEPALLRGYSVPYQDEYVCLFRRDKATPRYFFTSEFEVMSHSAVLDAIATAPSRQVLLESSPAIPAAPNQPDDPQPEVIAARLNSLQLRVRAPRPGLLYVADSFYDGWSVTVNGRPGNILPANSGFRAVAVPAGEVTVSFAYRPKGLLSGAAISLLSVCVALLLARRATGGAPEGPTILAG